MFFHFSFVQAIFLTLHRYWFFKSLNEVLEFVLTFVLSTLWLSKIRTPHLWFGKSLPAFTQQKIDRKFYIIATLDEIHIQEEDEEKTKFHKSYGLYEYFIMLFGVCNTPGTFQSYINGTLQELLDDFDTTYFDNKLICRENISAHTKDV